MLILLSLFLVLLTMNELSCKVNIEKDFASVLDLHCIITFRYDVFQKLQCNLTFYLSLYHFESALDVYKRQILNKMVAIVFFFVK